MPNAMPFEPAFEFAAANGLGPEADLIRNLSIHPSLQSDDAVRKSHLLDLFESRCLLPQFIAAHWPAGGTEAGRKKRAYYTMRRAKNDRLLGEGAGEPGPDAELRAELSAVEDQVEEQRFALEADLRDFLEEGTSPSWSLASASTATPSGTESSSRSTTAVDVSTSSPWMRAAFRW
jgi:hypothetical protein